MRGVITFRPVRLRQTAVLAGVAAVVAAGSVLGGASAHAATAVMPVSDLGNGLGAVTASPASGPTSGAVTWSSPACPSTAAGSAELKLVDPLRPTASQVLLGRSSSVSSPFTISESGSSTLNVALLGLADSIGGDTAEVVVECFPGSVLGGGGVYTDDAFVSFSSDESTYQVVPSPVGVALTASPNPTTELAPTTLTATESPASATGTIQFQANGKNIGKPVTISGGTASISARFIVIGEVAVVIGNQTIVVSKSTTASTVNLTAVYNPAAGSNFAATTPGSATLTVNP